MNKKLTVQQLIDRLLRVKDKNQDVYMEGCDCHVLAGNVTETDTMLLIENTQNYRV